MQHDMLTDLLIALIKHPDIRKACPIKASTKFNIREDWCHYYINQERQRRLG